MPLNDVMSERNIHKLSSARNSWNCSSKHVEMKQLEFGALKSGPNPSKL